MNKQIYSFSTKNSQDTEFVQKLKIRSMQSGQSFSHLVLQALKEKYQPEQTESIKGVK